MPGSERDLRRQVRDFLAAELPPDRRTALGMGAGHDPEFSAKLGARGWLGMAIPREFGGAGASAVDRLVVTEELLAAQAPVGAHWVADRQTGPSLLHYGTDAQRRELLPGICAGTSFWAIGMSEPESGSDVASVRTRAHRVDGGWRVEGRKVWTSWAHLSHYFTVLCRTSGEPADRQAGLSQLIVDLRSPGVQISPIATMDGGLDFCEVVLDGVFVPDDRVLGEIGQGWAQVTGELSHERGGPERWMSVWGLFNAAADRLDERTRGRLLARFRMLHELTRSVARLLDAGRQPVTEAAIVKVLGTTFEQQTLDTIRDAVGAAVEPDSRLADLLARTTRAAPTFTLRGGTTEVLRGLVAKQLPGPTPLGDDRLLADTADRAFASGISWDALAATGLPWLGIAEEHGGEGGTVADAATVLAASARHASELPVAENWVAAYVNAAAGRPVDRAAPPATGMTSDASGPGALARSVQIAAALEHVLALTARYAGQRTQFGRPLTKFQAVQHLLAQLAEQTVAARVAADLGTAGFRAGDDGQVAIAKSVCGEAAGAAARLAHQVHGAIGVTSEYALARYTQRLLAWRDECGPERIWETRIGHDAAALDAAGLWRVVVGETSPLREVRPNERPS